MLNQCVLVGRVKELKNNTLILAVSKSFKNEKGVYETDFINITLIGSIINNVNEYCNKGDIVGVKARVETGNKLIAEKITFLTSHKKED